MDKNKVLKEVHELLLNQSIKGFEKYGEFVKSDNLSTVEWIDHAREEIIDTLVYLTCLRERIENERRDNS